MQKWAPVDVVQVQDLRSGELRVVLGDLVGGGASAGVFPLGFDDVLQIRLADQVLLVLLQGLGVRDYVKVEQAGGAELGYGRPVHVESLALFYRVQQVLDELRERRPSLVVLPLL